MRASIVGAMAAIALLLGSVHLVACAAPQGANTMPTSSTNASPTAAEQQRFIVKFREGSGPARSAEAAKAHLDAMSALDGVQLQWQRRLGVQADLFFTSRPLDAGEAEALMQRFRADPDVEYIEPDARVGIDPIRGPDVRSDD
jgi:hypothetical protein